MENKKILVVHDYLTSYGGAERVLEEVLHLLPDADIYTSKYCPDLFPETSEIRKRNISDFWGFKLFNVNNLTRGLLSKLSYFSFLFINSKKYDLIFINTSGAALWILNKNCKFIAYYHKVPSFDFYSKINFIESIFSNFNKIFVRRLDMILTNSNFNKSIIEKIYKVADVQVLYPFVSESSLSIIDKVQKNQKDKYFVYIGRLESYKKIDKIIEICIENKIYLKVIGTGTLENILPKSEFVEYLGFVSDDEKFKILSSSSGLIALGGDREEFGIVYLESILCKTPFIALNVGGSVELSSSTNSILINDVTKLTQAIANLQNKIITEDEMIYFREKFSRKNFDQKFSSLIS